MAGHGARRPQLRGTQSLLHTLVACWQRPGLLGLELLWRWCFGLPALAITTYVVARVLAAPLRSAGLANLGLDNLSPQDPATAAQLLSSLSAALLPPLTHVALWLAPLLAIGWAVASGLGRSYVLRYLDPGMRFVPATLMLLQLLRIAALGGITLSWFLALHWAAGSTLSSGAEPNLVAYSGWVIFLTLGTFTLWALISWVFSIAPVLAMLEGTGVGGSILRSLRLGALTTKLVEINLVLGIVKLALVVLAMVFSATPLPFTTVMTGTPLYLWWAFVTVLYLIASDFFQVARLAAFVQLWYIYHPRDAAELSRLVGEHQR